MAEIEQYLTDIKEFELENKIENIINFTDIQPTKTNVKIHLEIHSILNRYCEAYFTVPHSNSIEIVYPIFFKLFPEYTAQETETINIMNKELLSVTPTWIICHTVNLGAEKYPKEPVSTYTKYEWINEYYGFAIYDLTPENYDMNGELIKN